MIGFITLSGTTVLGAFSVVLVVDYLIYRNTTHKQWLIDPTALRYHIYIYLKKDIHVFFPPDTFWSALVLYFLP